MAYIVGSVLGKLPVYNRYLKGVWNDYATSFRRVSYDS